MILSDAPIRMRANAARRWHEGGYEVLVLHGDCEIRQGDFRSQSGSAVIWIDQAESLDGRIAKVIVYLEQAVDSAGIARPVTVDLNHRGRSHRATGRSAQTIQATRWLGRLRSRSGIHLDAPTVDGSPRIPPEIVRRGLAAREQESQAAVRRAQFLQQEISSLEGVAAPRRNRRVTIRGRSNVRPEASFEEDPVRNESVVIVKNGVRIIIEGVDLPNVQGSGKIVVETDHLVAWLPRVDELSSGGTLDAENVPVELFMEGNIVFRQGDRVIYAERMYYNVEQEYGGVLNAEIWTPVPQYEGLLRLKADVLQQLDRQNFQAFGAAVTSSRLGYPRYWLQSENVSFQDVQHVQSDPATGQLAIDPRTLDPLVEHELRTTSRNNFVYLAGVPIFYWPVFTTDLTKPSYFIDQIRINDDSVFGTQIRADLDVFQLLGWRGAPPGTQWTVSNDYLSERGFGAGTNLEYSRETFFSHPWPYRGVLDVWAIHDQGLDNLGLDRRAVVPEEEYRGRVFWQHRQHLHHGFQFTAEAGLISDRNFLEQYFENEYDQFKDQTTGIELKQYVENGSWSVASDVRLNDFFTQTEWLPRLDHFQIGESLLDVFTWYEHTHVGYAKLRRGNLPAVGAQPPQSALPWETDQAAAAPFRDREGLRVATRQELDAPLDVGPIRLVPYVLGEVAFWNEDRDADDVTRLYGQAGVRSSLPMWKSFPAVRSTLLNLDGLAHKVSLESEFFWADANKDLARLPLYDPLNDDSVEAFQRMFIPAVYAGTLPARFDDRLYALRTGLQSNVTGPTEIADDLMIARLGVHQRWQTKRGLPGRQRIVDWVALDVDGVLYPKPGRDNFGQDVGLMTYDFSWHLGDRLTLLSDGFVDVFGDGMKRFTVGGFMSRPGVGNAYFGFRSIEGPISSSVLASAVNYRMTEKWILTAGAAFDLGPTGNIGQTFAFTRIGESLLIRVGFNADVSRGNVGATIAVEPRFLPQSRLGRIGGVRIPPAGAYGLE